MSHVREVQRTAHDALISKLSAVQHGYYRDDYVVTFAHPAPSGSTREFQAEFMRTVDDDAPLGRRPPLMNRGYYSRVAAVDKILRDFLETTQTRGLPSQVISLGAGMDTTYWRLKAHQGLSASRYVEIDYADTLRHKLSIIRNTFALKDVLEAQDSKQIPHPVSLQTESLETAESVDKSWIGLSQDYAMLMSDLSHEPEAILRVLLQGSSPILTSDLPTLILSECVIVYIEPNQANALLRAFTSQFAGPLFLVMYEQVFIHDEYGRGMLQNLRQRGCPLLGLEQYPDFDSQNARLKDIGFKTSVGRTMYEIYRYFLDPEEIRRVEAIRSERFDEYEEWYLIQSHYGIWVAAKPQDGIKSVPTTQATNQAGETDLVSTSTTQETKESKQHHAGSHGDDGYAGLGKLGLLGCEIPANVTYPSLIRRSHLVSTNIPVEHSDEQTYVREDGVRVTKGSLRRRPPTEPTSTPNSNNQPIQP